MKKRLCIVLIVLLSLALVPRAASANSPAPDPARMTVECRNVEKESQITFLLAGEDGVFHAGETYTVYQSGSTRLTFYRGEGDTQFCIELTAPDGTFLQSNAVPLKESGKYAYDANSNELKAVGSFADDWLGVLWLPALVIAYLVLPIAIALAVTLLIEFLVSLCFRLKPRRYVILINLITNPVMNLILRIGAIFIGGEVAYWIALAILELLVCGVEFWFYTRKYKDKKIGLLLAFTLVANALSAAAGILLNQFFL